jgi:hypothetical protein
MELRHPFHPGGMHKSCQQSPAFVSLLYLFRNNPKSSPGSHVLSSCDSYGRFFPKFVFDSSDDVGVHLLTDV